jgi:hypothetical protein
MPKTPNIAKRLVLKFSCLVNHKLNFDRHFTDGAGTLPGSFFVFLGVIVPTVLNESSTVGTDKLNKDFTFLD